MLNAGQKQDTRYPAQHSYWTTFLKIITGLILIALLVYILGHPKSPLRDYIAPETIPEVPFLPSHYGEQDSSTGITTMGALFVFIGFIVAVFLLIGFNQQKVDTFLEYHAPDWTPSIIKTAPEQASSIITKVKTNVKDIWNNIQEKMQNITKYR
jgi:amino acid transporter